MVYGRDGGRKRRAEQRRVAVKPEVDDGDLYAGAALAGVVPCIGVREVHRLVDRVSTVRKRRANVGDCHTIRQRQQSLGRNERFREGARDAVDGSTCVGDIAADGDGGYTGLRSDHDADGTTVRRYPSRLRRRQSRRRPTTRPNTRNTSETGVELRGLDSREWVSARRGVRLSAAEPGG